MPRFNNNNCANAVMIDECVGAYRFYSNNDFDIIFEGLSLDKVSIFLRALGLKSLVKSIEFQLNSEISENDPNLARTVSVLKEIIDANNSANDDEIQISIYHADEVSSQTIAIINKIFAHHGIEYTLLSSPTIAKKSSTYESSQASDDDCDAVGNSLTSEVDDIENFSSLNIAQQLEAEFFGKKHAIPFPATSSKQTAAKSPKIPAAAKSHKATKLLGDKNEYLPMDVGSKSKSVADCPVVPMDADQASKADKSALLPSPAKVEKKPEVDSTRGKILKRRLFPEAPPENTPVSTDRNRAPQLSGPPQLSSAVLGHADHESQLSLPDSSHEKLDKKNKIISALHALDSERCLAYYSSRYTEEPIQKEKVLKKEGGYGNLDRIQKQYCDLYRLIDFYNFPLLNATPIDESVLVAHKENVYPETEYYFLGDQVHIKGMGMLYDPFRVNKPDKITIQIANDLFRRIRYGINSIKQDKHFKQLDSSNVSIKRLVCSTGTCVDNIVIVAPSGHTDGSDTIACTEIKEKFWHILAEVVAQMNEDVKQYPSITFLFQTHYNNLAAINRETLEVMKLGDYVSCQVNKSLQIIILRAIDASLRKRHPSYATAFSKLGEKIGDKGCSEMKTLSLELKLRSIYDKVEIIGVENTSLTSLLKMPDQDRHSREYGSRLPCVNCMRTIPAYNVLLSMHEVLTLPPQARKQFLASKAQTTFFMQDKKPDGFFGRQMPLRNANDSSAAPPLTVPTTAHVAPPLTVPNSRSMP